MQNKIYLTLAQRESYFRRSPYVILLIFTDGRTIYYRSGRKFALQWLGLGPDRIFINLPSV